MRAVASFLKGAQVDHFVKTTNPAKIKTFQSPMPVGRIGNRSKDQARLAYNTMIWIEKKLDGKPVSVRLERAGTTPGAQYLVFEAKGPEGHKHLDALEDHLKQEAVTRLNENQSKLAVNALTGIIPSDGKGVKWKN